MKQLGTVTYALFCVAAVVFLVLAGLLVLGQVVSVVALQGPWITAIGDALMPPTLYAAVAMGITGFVYGYVRKPASED